MSALRRMSARHLLLAITLAATWCAMWGEVTIANAISGAALAVVALGIVSWFGPGGPVRPVALAQLVGLVVVDLFRSTVAVVREVLTPTDRTDERVVAVDVGDAAADHLYFLVVAITLTPGTAVIDAEPETGRLFLHLLHADTEPDVVDHVRRLAEVAERALPNSTQNRTLSS